MVAEPTVDRLNTSPRAAHARATATSPSGSAIRCRAMGATMNGDGQRRPSTSTEASRPTISTPMRGTKRQRSNAAMLSRSVTSSLAAPE